jgi:hypothetical protein
VSNKKKYLCHLILGERKYRAEIRAGTPAEAEKKAIEFVLAMMGKRVKVISCEEV